MTNHRINWPLLLGIEALTVLSIWGIGLLYQLPTVAFRLALAVFLLETAILFIMWRNAKGRTSPSLREGWLIYCRKAFQAQLPVFALALALLSLSQSGLLQFFVWHVLILSHSILFLCIFYGVQLRKPAYLTKRHQSAKEQS